ncbi:hypothetical protein MJO29_014062 [Puccinia striiformis f. sp. tritici]|uniref:hypothetical protein n=1 Tax=Puccinia striiformis f. sp. tritici TaxID=168172 RepID=UPI002007EB94|nr:hypothetical protein Pst134EA_026674 [Puccinia striiformis f. sp. tritici]KAH9449961.1 hypothetical protein Pst134EA_026674 [Puccinia striiformis f. sp. tritici]KAI7939326.1 hypothetical protein MJO29_014062 [Puccinia striiformis f. sp. tritici]
MIPQYEKPKKSSNSPTMMKQFILVTSLWMVSLIASTGGSMNQGFPSACIPDFQLFYLTFQKDHQSLIPSAVLRQGSALNPVKWEPESQYYYRDANGIEAFKRIEAFKPGTTSQLLARSGNGAKEFHNVDTGGVTGGFQFNNKHSGYLTLLSTGNHDLVYILHDVKAQAVVWERLLKRGTTDHFSFPSGADNQHLELYTRIA